MLASFRRLSICLPVLGLVGLGCALAQPAGASATGPVSTNPADFTPQLASSNGVVRQLTQCGTTMYAAGSFSSIKQGSRTYARNNVFSFDATTGAVTTWNPGPNGVTNTVALSADCSTAYLGGSFSNVAGTAATNLAAVSTAGSGTLLSGFARSANNQVETIFVTPAHILVGGYFSTINSVKRGYFASLNPTTGAVDSYLNLNISGHYPGNANGTRVYNTEVSHAGTRLLVMGDFTSVGGQGRQQIFMLDLGAGSATVDAWNSPQFSMSCSASEPYYLQAASWSPDDSSVYVASTGYVGSSPLCDAVAAYSSASSSSLRYTWINKTGGDSLYATAADANDVYIGGHERWANNPFGSDNCGPGCVSRPGVGDISPTTGLATSWNPTRDRGHGADDMLLTSAGLWIADDNGLGSSLCGHEQHPGICFFPY